jgi:hypothetical protein
MPSAAAAEMRVRALDVHVMQQRRERDLARPFGRVVHPDEMIRKIGPTLISRGPPSGRLVAFVAIRGTTPRSVILPTQLAASGLPSTCKPSPNLTGAVARTSQVPMISLCT